MRLKIFLLGLFFLANAFNASAQVWSRIYNGFGIIGPAISQCYDKGLSFAYNSDSNGLAMLMKADVNGNPLWLSVLNNDSFEYESSDTTMDGGFILGGGGYNPSGNPFLNIGSPFILKLDACGHKEWSDVFKDNSPYQDKEFVFNIQQLNHGDYIMCLDQDVSNANPIISHLNNKGVPAWSVLFRNAFIGNIIRETDGNFLITGINSLNTVQNAFTAKIDPTGKVLWINNYSGIHGQGSWVSIETYQIKDNGYLTLFTSGGNLLDTVQVLKLDSNGKKQYLKQWGYVSNGIGYLDMIYDSFDNSYIMLETTLNIFNINDSVKLIKLDSNINILRTKKYPYPDYEGDLIPTYYNQILIGSYTHLTDSTQSFHLWKINSDLEQDSFDDSDHFVYDYKCKSAITDTVSLAGADTIVIDTNNMTIVDDSIITVRSGISQVIQLQSNLKITITPNPFTGVLHVSFNNMGSTEYIGTLRVINSLGQPVQTQPIDIIPQFSGEFDIDLSKLSNGFYYIVVQDNKSILYQNSFIKE